MIGAPGACVIESPTSKGHGPPSQSTWGTQSLSEFRKPADCDPWTCQASSLGGFGIHRGTRLQ